MTKAELIAENERIKENLKEIYKLTSIRFPQDDKYEKEYYDKGDFAGFYAYRMGAIRATVKNALDPEWMYRNLTDEEEAEFIASL